MRPERRQALRSAAALAPALGLIALLFGASIVYGAAQSLGWLPFLGQRELSLDAYAAIVAGPRSAEFWTALGFSLWVSAAATLVSAALALGATLAFGPAVGQRRRLLTLINLNLGFPHLVWAIGMLLLLDRSGLIARIAYAVGLIDAPADFPVLIRDRFGLGIILTYITKEVPFLMLVVVAILRNQAVEYGQVAATLGASRWQRLRFVTWPLVRPGLVAASLLVFAYVFGAYEVPALTGVRFPEMVAVLALDYFLDPNLAARAQGMALSVIMAVVVLAVAAASLAWRQPGRG